MPTEGHVAKFLYTILRQLDLRSIDWNEVAETLNVSNGHAARMRYFRLKMQMEAAMTLPPRHNAVSRRRNENDRDSNRMEQALADVGDKGNLIRPEDLYGHEQSVSDSFPLNSSSFGECIPAPRCESIDHFPTTAATSQDFGSMQRFSSMLIDPSLRSYTSSPIPQDPGDILSWPSTPRSFNTSEQTNESPDLPDPWNMGEL